MAIAKLLSLLLMTIGNHYAFTAPNVRPPTKQLRELRGSELATPYIVGSSKVIVWIWTLLEGSVPFALSGLCPRVLARPILHFLLPSVDPVTVTMLTPITLCGSLLSFSGALLRAHCFHVLGERFTFELSIRPTHRLVTDGVYRIVRHPSYTAILMLAVGWVLCAVDRHGVLVWWAYAAMQSKTGDVSETGGMKEVGTVSLVCVGAIIVGGVFVIMNKRINKEDAMLEKNFGDEWRSWVERVPYRLVQGVY